MNASASEIARTMPLGWDRQVGSALRVDEWGLVHHRLDHLDLAGAAAERQVQLRPRLSGIQLEGIEQSHSGIVTFAEYVNMLVRCIPELQALDKQLGCTIRTLQRYNTESVAAQDRYNVLIAQDYNRIQEMLCQGLAATLHGSETQPDTAQQIYETRQLMVDLVYAEAREMRLGNSCDIKAEREMVLNYFQHTADDFKQIAVSALRMHNATEVLLKLGEVVLPVIQCSLESVLNVDMKQSKDIQHTIHRLWSQSTGIDACLEWAKKNNRLDDEKCKPCVQLTGTAPALIGALNVNPVLEGKIFGHAAVRVPWSTGRVEDGVTITSLFYQNPKIDNAEYRHRIMQWIDRRVHDTHILHLPLTSRVALAETHGLSTWWLATFDEHYLKRCDRAINAGKQLRNRILHAGSTAPCSTIVTPLHPFSTNRTLGDHGHTAPSSELLAVTHFALHITPLRVPLCVIAANVGFSMAAPHNIEFFVPTATDAFLLYVMRIPCIANTLGLTTDSSMYTSVNIGCTALYSHFLFNQAFLDRDVVFTGVPTPCMPPSDYIPLASFALEAPDVPEDVCKGWSDTELTAIQDLCKKEASESSIRSAWLTHYEQRSVVLGQ